MLQGSELTDLDGTRPKPSSRSATAPSPPESRRRMGRCFPLSLGCCPAFCESWRNIHSCQHLLLLTTVTLGLGLTIYDISRASLRGCIISLNGIPNFCITELIEAIFLLPCTCHLIRVLRNYDDRTRSTMRDLCEQKQATQRAYTDMIRDMLDMWSRACDNNFQLAQRNFEDKLEDMLRFLQTLAQKCETAIFINDQEERVVAELREFVRIWFLTYGEASIDPQDHPLIVEVRKELENCRSVVMLLRMAIALLEQCRSTASIQRCMSFLNQDPNALLHLTSGNTSGSRRGVGRRLIENELAYQEVDPACCSWCGCCKRRQNSNQNQLRDDLHNLGGDSDDDLCSVSCCGDMCWISIIDNAHARMVVAFLAGLVVIGLRITEPFIQGVPALSERLNEVAVEAAPIILYEICLIVLLTKVEYISSVAALRAEVKQVEQLTNKVNDLKAEVTNFASQSVDLTELWLHCTIPRLDLMKEVHHHLTSASVDDLLPQLTLANDRLRALESWCGGVSGWRAASLSGGQELERRRLSHRIDLLLRNATEDDLEDSRPGTPANLDKLIEVLDNDFREEFGVRPHIINVAALTMSPTLQEFCSAQRARNLPSVYSFTSAQRPLIEDPATLNGTVDSFLRDGQRSAGKRESFGISNSMMNSSDSDRSLQHSRDNPPVTLEAFFQ